jgi:hypothetical protein
MKLLLSALSCILAACVLLYALADSKGETSAPWERQPGYTVVDADHIAVDYMRVEEGVMQIRRDTVAYTWQPWKRKATTNHIQE